MKKLLSISCVFTLFIISCQQPVKELKVKEITDKEILLEDGTNFEITGFGDQGTTTFILIRHAESQVIDDPDLTELGLEHAKHLTTVLKDFPLKNIFSTYTKRTRATVTPIAESQGLEIVNYSSENQEGLITSIMRHGAGGNYLIVGHSNTIPSLLNLFKGNEVYENIDKSVYDDLFVVVAKSVGDAQIVALKY